MPSEITRAKISHGQLKTSCGKALESVHSYLKDLEKAEPKDVTTAQLGTLGGMVKRGRQAISNYGEAVIKCLEDIPEKKHEDDEHAIQRGKFVDRLNDMECRIEALGARIYEEKALAKAKEAATGRQYWSDPGQSTAAFAKRSHSR